MQYLSYLKRFIGFSQYILGDAELLSITKDPNFVSQFVTATGDSSAQGILFDVTETSVLSIPNNIGYVDSVTMNDFYQRWNLTFSNWNTNNLTSPNNDFIDYFTMQYLFDTLLNDQENAVNQGFSDVIQGYSDSLEQFIKKAGESESGNF
jgi:hypothetical protein